MNTIKNLYGLSDYISVFSQTDWNELDSIVETILTKSPCIFETPRYGDSRNEYVDMRVARFITRKNSLSEIIDNPYSQKILAILKKSNFVSQIEKKTGLKKLKILRAQLNIMETNSVLGLHTDKESDAAFEITALIRTQSACSGGELCIYGDNPQIVSQENHTVFLMDSNSLHEVKEVQSGNRNSLIILLGRE